MEGKAAMISRILEDAEKKASEMRAAAEAEQATRISAAQKWAEELLPSSRKALADEADATVERRETVARLDGRKKVLGAKRELIDEVFARALEKAQNFPKARYAEIVSRLLEENAEEGDTVVLSRFAPLSQSETEALPVFRARKLRFGGADGAFAGGLFLSNETCDKDLSFEALIAADRVSLESDVVEILFSDGRKTE